MKNYKEMLIELVEHLEVRPLMYLGELNYTSLSNFLQGCLFTVDQIYSLSLNLKFTEWLNAKGTKTSMWWTSYILLVQANRDDELACKILFKELKEFLSSTTTE